MCIVPVAVGKQPVMMAEREGAQMGAAAKGMIKAHAFVGEAVQIRCHCILSSRVYTYVGAQMGADVMGRNPQDIGMGHVSALPAMVLAAGVRPAAGIS